MNGVPGTHFTLLLAERDGVLKGSFRTPKEEVDVAKIARSFGGGGHKKAAGFSVPGRVVEKNGEIVIEKK